MKKRATKRILALLLTVAMMVSLSPAAFAEGEGFIEEPEAIETPELTEEPEPVETPEPPEEPEPIETPEPTEEPEPIETPEPAEEPDPIETPEPTEEPEEEEEEEPEEEELLLPCGFAGLPEGYVLSDYELEAKAALNEHEVPETLAGLIPGFDYVEGEVVFLADDFAYAELVAAAYSATLLSCEYGVAVLLLPETATVLDAVTAAADMELPLPAVEPNYITSLEPVADAAVSAYSSAMAIPGMQSWESWVTEIMDNPDPYLLDPGRYDYQYQHDMVNSYEAWGVTTGSSDVIVAVVDSGVYAGHPDLAGHVTAEMDFTGEGNGDGNGHGTHVAGIIAATMNNGLGGAGIAPNVSLISARVLGSNGEGTTENIIKGINWAVDAGANIINMSLGNYAYNYAEDQAVQRAAARGVTVIAAMGNDGSNIMCYPAAFNNVIAVAAVDASGSRAGYSNYGAWADVAAPGSNILSTANNGDYVTMDGTSMAAPVVSGVAALYMSAVGYVSPAAMEKALKASVTKAGSSQIGAGIVDASKLFAGDKTAPVFTVCTPDGSTVTNFRTPVVYGSKVSITPAGGSSNGAMIIYTTDGKAPAIKDGAIVSGQAYTEAIDLSAFPANKSITIKAACISGLGVLGKAATLTLKMAPAITVSNVQLDGPKHMVAGKSVTLTATVFGPDGTTDSVSQKGTWDISSCSAGMEGASINKATGALRTAAGKAGSLTVLFKPEADDTKSYTLNITVTKANPIATMTLNYSKYTLNVSAGEQEQVELSVDTLKDAKKQDIDKETVGFSWVSSNKKVATVDENGLVTAVGKGSASITCKALDGSNKTARCTITVAQLVESVAVTGQLSIAPSASATYKAAVLPATANNKKVTWSLIDAPAGVTISASGAVKVPSTVTSGTFTVCAQAADAGGQTGSVTVEIQKKTTYLNLYPSSEQGNFFQFNTYNRSGWLTGARISTVDVPDPDDLTDYHANENVIVLEADTDCKTALKWTTSNAKVATVDESGRVEGVANGTATITCAAQDGSNKKATVRIQVTTPCSSITVTPKNLGQTALACGKTLAFKATAGDAYGKPSSTKVSWDYQVIRMADSGNVEDGEDWTDVARSKKLVTLSSAGVLSVSKAFVSYVQTDDFIIRVLAVPTDGSIWSGSYDVVPVAATTYILTEYNTYTAPKNSFVEVHFVSDCMSDFTVTTSNPKVAGSYYAGWVIGSNGIYYMAVQIKTGDAGTAKITVKANDGSGKSKVITLKVS